MKFRAHNISFIDLKIVFRLSLGLNDTAMFDGRNFFQIENVDAIVRLSREYGEEHVALKAHGFKPDFWVSLVDAITLECIILDLANHQVGKFVF